MSVNKLCGYKGYRDRQSAIAVLKAAHVSAEVRGTDRVRDSAAEVVDEDVAKLA